ncbi:hypothetical protein [Halofilum ochraceum]|uniref:hypothetical protein n=1 Tax=Halofilum ochraceum TaxID=1611323 RepID=UPI0008DB13BA|nr:hypothetical protein [Halofilum ochraceum]
MGNGQSRMEEIMASMPLDLRLVAETIRTCATSEFSRRWPDSADDMAAVVCGRWLHTTPAEHISASDSARSRIDRLVNESFATLDDEQIAATERMFEKLSRAWREQ